MNQSTSVVEVCQYRKVQINSTSTKGKAIAGLFTLALAVVTMIALSGCAGLTAAPPAAPSGSTGTASLAASPTTVSFANVSVGTTAKQTVTISNSGTASENVTSISATGSAFSITGITLPYALAAGSSTTFTAQFTPTASGTATGSLAISASSGSTDPTVTVALTGTATQAGISVSPSSVSFGTVIVGQTNSQPIKISNSGSAALTISGYTATGAGFSVSGLTTPLTVQAGQSASFNVKFSPTTASSSSGSISLASNASSSASTVALTGTGAAATYSLSVSPSTVSFGNVKLNASTSQTVSLKNTGNSSITISSVKVTGSGFSDSGVNAGLVLSPSQSASLNVAFAPTTSGSVSGSVAIASNAANSPESVQLSGAGITTHTVALAWVTSTSSGVVGYNVYRGTVSGTYSKLNSSPLTSAAYTDSTVQSGQNTTYYYVVTAVNSSGVESTDSNQATAVVP